MNTTSQLDRLPLLFTLLLGTLLSSPLPADREAAKRWLPDMKKFAERDQTDPPPQGAILFVGSSSIRKWNLDTSFPKLDVINRGFGGSQISDSIVYADRIVLPYRPRTIVLYAGDNDIAKGKTPKVVHRDFLRFTKVVRTSLPETKILFIAIKPSLSRWKLADPMRRANALIEATCEGDPKLTFIDIWQPMLGPDGTPTPELFVKDGLHLSEDGYALWAKILRPHLVRSRSTSKTVPTP